MRYVITQLWLGYQYEIEITRKEFEELKVTRSKLLLLSGLEEKFMLLLENYEEFEQEMIRLSLNHMIYVEREMPVWIDNIRLLNRRLANLLTTCRLYNDHSAHDISTFYGKESDQFVHYKQLQSKYYDENLGYRVMESARNFIQHQSLIIYGTSFNRKRIKDEDRIVHLAMVYLNVSQLREEGNFKKRVLLELEAIADEKGNVDIRPFVREYISSIGGIHLEIRKMFVEELIVLDNTIANAIQRLNEAAGENYDSVQVIAYGDENKVIDRFAVLRDFVERRRRVVNKTQFITHFAGHYVSNK